jgi:predicted O-methyltransferase YrrM
VSQHGFQGFGIFTHLTWQERIILYKMVTSLNPRKVLVEIGSYLGGSGYFLAAGAAEGDSDTSLFCIDTWMNDGMSEGQRDTWIEFNENVSRFSSIIIPCRGGSKEIAQTFSREIDLLFIDGDHTFDGCMRDVESWLPLVRSGGIVLFHDYGWADGVQKVVHILLSRSKLTNAVAYQNIFWASKA